MKKILLILVFVLSGCAYGQSSVVQGEKAKIVEDVAEQETEGFKEADEPLILIGEGGPSGAMFIKSASTFQKENGGVFYEVHNGDEFVAAVEDFVENYGRIKHMIYFGHGNHVGLYVNQAPNVNGALYANDINQNEEYIAASIFELPQDIFAEHGWIKFNGCNVADGYPEKDNLAQRFANYFDVDVVAPTGPTEFSTDPTSVDPIPNSSYLDSSFDGEVYMVPTYSEQGFIIVKPQEKSASGFDDVREGQAYEEAVVELAARGLDLGFVDGKFWPYQNVNYEEAREFCRVALGDLEKCEIDGYANDQKIRNLKALQMLVDGYGVELTWTNPWYDSYVWWANQNELLTEDFVTKKWYTRGEMAQLTWKFMQHFSN